MADFAVILSNESVSSLAATTTAINTLLSAEIAAVAPSPVQVFNVSVAAAVGPIYCQSVLIKYQD